MFERTLELVKSGISEMWNPDVLRDLLVEIFALQLEMWNKAVRYHSSAQNDIVRAVIANNDNYDGFRYFKGMKNKINDASVDKEKLQNSLVKY